MRPPGMRTGSWYESGATVTSTGTGLGPGQGQITLDGAAGTGWNGNFGVYLTGAGTSIASVEGAIHVRGQGDGLMDYNGGILLNWVRIESAGTAPITLEGMGGAGTDNQYGVWLRDPGTALTSQGGNIHVVGQGGPEYQNANHGVLVTTGHTSRRPERDHRDPGNRRSRPE